MRTAIAKISPVYRTTLELLKSTYFSEEAANSRSQPAFSKLEVLYVQRKNNADELVQQYRQTVAECGFELTTVSMQEAFEGSQTSINIDTPGKTWSPFASAVIKA